MRSALGSFTKLLFRSVEHGKGLVCGGQSCSQTLEFRNSSLPILGIESLNRILDQGNATPTFEQTFGGQANAVFGHDAKDDKFGSMIQTF